jgi:AraC family transcriptional regulator
MSYSIVAEYAPRAFSHWDFRLIRRLGSYGMSLVECEVNDSDDVLIPGVQELVLSLRLSGFAAAERDLGFGLERFDSEPNEVFMTPPDATGQWRWRTNGGRCANIGIPKALVAAWGERVDTRTAQLMLNCAPSRLRSPDLIAAMQALLAHAHAAQCDPLLADSLIDGVVQALALALHQQDSAQLARLHGRTIKALSDAELRRVLARMRCEELVNPSLADLAELTGMSTCHFLRAFKKTLGTTPHEYLTFSRMQRACQLMRETRLPILDIGVQLGFATHSHFSQVFRRQVGMAPAQFRRVLNATH